MLVLVLLGLGVAVLVVTLGAGAGHRQLVEGTSAAADGLSSGGAGGGESREGASGGSAGGAGVGDGTGALASGATLYVHVLGAVNRPGLYSFHEGDRAIDAVAAAGGYTGEADRRVLNLARYLSDGEQIIVPTQGETASGALLNAGGSGGSGLNGGKVNLNTADAAALETLPRVGPALAARILAWREENGRFTSIEDLMSVSGIGDKTFAGLEDLVTV